MQKITILAISATFFVTLLAITAFEVVEAKPLSEVLVVNTEPIAVTGISSSPICPAENVQHWMNVRLVAAVSMIHASEPVIRGGEDMFLQIPITGSEVFAFDDRNQHFADRLNDLGYTLVGGDPITDSAIGSTNLDANSIGYSTICAEN